LTFSKPERVYDYAIAENTVDKLYSHTSASVGNMEPTESSIAAGKMMKTYTAIFIIME